MLKRRLIPVLNIMNGLIVRSEDFKLHQNIGNVINQAERYNDWEVDELIYLDISRSQKYDLNRDDHKVNSYTSIEEIIKRISKVCFMPLAFGGGIRSIKDVDIRIKNGADKVVVNTGAFLKPEFITEISKKYGKQAVIVSVDYRNIDGKNVVFINHGSENTNVEVLDWCKKVESLGAGEIFLNSIDRDGHGDGYDINFINQVVGSLSIPTIACGGAGNFEDFVDLALESEVSAIAAGNIFHFTERSYPRAKKLLKKENVNVR